MKRRDFITRAAIAGGTISFGLSCNRKIESAGPELTQGALTQASAGGKFITEPARQLPVFAETDVLVIGGGPAGTAAAIAASRAGADTWLVERYNHLGGLWTGGLVLPLLSTHAADKNKRTRQVIFGIGGEMSGRLKKLGMSVHEINPVIDPEAGKYVLDQMITESGVKMLYHTWASNVLMEGNRIAGVVVENKSGRMAIMAKVVVDCTGDGDILNLAGEGSDMMKYHIGLVHRIGNVDRIKPGSDPSLKPLLGDETPLKGVNWVNMHGDNEQDGTDIMTLSNLQLKYRKEIWDNVQKIRSTPGYEEVFLLDTASQLGVRMSRILDGRYKLTLEDTMTFKSFKDVIGISGAWTTMLYMGKAVKPENRPYWQIPYRSLLPKKTENLLVAGRCFCFERELVEDTRIIGTCLVTGHGAGAAAALAAKNNEAVQDIDTGKLKDLLISQGAWLG